MDEKRRKGLALFEEVYGKDMADGICRHVESSTTFGVKQAEWTLDWTFGSVWASDSLERKLRSCAVLGMLIALGAKEEIKAHTRMGLANGLTRSELEEIFHTAIAFAGAPAANLGRTAMLEVFASIDGSEIGPMLHNEPEQDPL